MRYKKPGRQFNITKLHPTKMTFNFTNSNSVKISDYLLHMQGGAMAHLRTPFEYAEKAL